MTATAGLAWARLVARSAGVQALAWGAAAGLVVTTSAVGYTVAYPSAAERAAVQAGLGANTGIAALFGTPTTLGTVAGFTEWRSIGVVMFVGLVWGVVTGARVGRRDEQDGRREWPRAGLLDARRAALGDLAGLAVAGTGLFATTASGTLLGSVLAHGWGLGPSLWLAAVLCLPAALATALGLCAAQLATTARGAAALAGAVVGALYLLRLVAGAEVLRWPRAVDPLLWIDGAGTLDPPGPGRVRDAAAVLVLVIALCAAAVVMTSGRESGAAYGRRPRWRPLRARPVGSVASLTVREELGAATGWAAAQLGLAVAVGVLAAPVGRAMSDTGLLRRLTGARVVGPAAFVGATMVTFAALLMLCGASLVASGAADERAGRVDLVLAGTTGRRRWFAVRVGGALALVVVLALATAAVLWSAAAVSGGHGADGLGARALADAGLNLVPPAAVVVAAAALGWALHPAWARLGVVVVAWSFVVALLADVVSLPAWLADTSVLHHLRAAPAQPPDRTAWVVLVSVAVLSLLAAGAAVARRDLATR